MDTKLILLLCSIFVNYQTTDAVDCYVCSSINNYQYDMGSLRNQNCEDISDSGSSDVEQQSGCSSCIVADFDIGYRVQSPNGEWESTEERVVTRQCSYELLESKCLNAEDVMSRDQVASETQQRMAAMGLQVEVQVTKFEGEECGCNYDLCNSQKGIHAASLLTIAAFFCIMRALV